MSGYEFHANALGVGGVVSFGGRKTTIPSAASAVLSPGGGEGYGLSENYDANGVSWDRAESRVIGTEIGNGIFYTYTDVLITNLAVYDPLNIPRLRIAMMGLQMATTRNPGTSDSQFEVRLSYRGINVDGADHEPMVDVALCSAPTFKDVATALNGDPGGYALRFGIEPPEKLQEALEKVEDACNPTQRFSGALVRQFSAPDGTVTTGCALPVPNVGTAHFGEFIFKPGDRRLRLLRLNVQAGFGRPLFMAQGGEGVPQAFIAESTGGDNGDIVFGAVEGNGSPPF